MAMCVEDGDKGIEYMRVITFCIFLLSLYNLGPGERFPILWNPCLVSISATVTTFLKPRCQGMITINKRLYVFNVYNLMSLEISVHLWNHDYNPCHKPESSLPSSYLLLLLFVCMCDKNIQCNIYPVRHGHSLQFIVQPRVSQVTELAHICSLSHSVTWLSATSAVGVLWWELMFCAMKLILCSHICLSLTLQSHSSSRSLPRQLIHLNHPHKTLARVLSSHVLMSSP